MVFLGCIGCGYFIRGLVYIFGNRYFFFCIGVGGCGLYYFVSVVMDVFVGVNYWVWYFDLLCIDGVVVVFFGVGGCVCE